MLLNSNPGPWKTQCQPIISLIKYTIKSNVDKLIRLNKCNSYGLLLNSIPQEPSVLIHQLQRPTHLMITPPFFCTFPLIFFYFFFYFFFLLLMGTDYRTRNGIRRWPGRQKDRKIEK